MIPTEPRIVSTVRTPARATVRVIGELDRAGVARLRAELAGWRQAGPIELLLDLSAVPRCDPTLARTLAWARAQLRGAGGELIVTGDRDTLREQIRAAVEVVQTFPGQHTDWPATLLHPHLALTNPDQP